MVQLKCYGAPIAMLLAVLASDASASIQLPSMFASAMVLQHDEAVALWGVALPNVDVSINYYSSRSSSSFQWNGKVRSTSSGRFDVILPAQPVSTLPYTLTIAATGSNNITLKDILIGKVFVCSGQSNSKGSTWQHNWNRMEAFITAPVPMRQLLDGSRCFYPRVSYI